MEDVRGGVGLIPAFREPGLRFVAVVLLYERIEDEHVDALRLHVEADAGVKVDRARLDEHHGGVRVRFAAASGNQQRAQSQREMDTVAATFRHT